ncbi:MAG TPA: hypothetical protein VJT08_16850 [Terriglobales bacterium]|nr:hypothetical protein [Terriglobales bacterium]
MAFGAGGGMGHSSMGMSHSTTESTSTRGNEAHSPTSLLQSNDQLNTHLSTALTKSGVTLPNGGLQTACAGFKNLGQCVAALHVSNNLKIGFDCLKADLVGQAPPDASACPSGTGSSKMSMGKAITTLQPSADAKAEAKKPKKQASQDLSESES